MNEKTRYMPKFRRYLRRTYKNKLYATVMFIGGLISALISDGDATAFVFFSCISIPLFFAKDNWIS